MTKLNKVISLLIVGIFLVNIIGCSKESVVAKVNGKEITREQLDKTMDNEKKQLEKIGKSLSKEKLDGLMNSLESRVLESLINREIILQEAEKQGVMPSDKEIDTLINNIIQKYGSKEKFEAGLNKTNNKLTIEEYKQMQKERLAMTNLFQKVTKDTKVNDQEIKKYYDDNKGQFIVPEKMKRILIKFDSQNDKVGRNEADAKKLAQSIIKRIKSGEDFAKLAKEYSEDVMTKDIGGEYGYNPLIPNSDQEFIKVVKNLKAGQLTSAPAKVIGLRYSGFYIVKFISPYRQKDYSEVKNIVAQKLKDIKKSEKWQKYYTELIKSAKVEKFIKK